MRYTRLPVPSQFPPFATLEPNVGVVGVPDARLARLSEIHSSEKILPATVQFVDIAGIVKGASEGEGMGNKFLSNIRESDAICQVTRVFEDDDITHVDGKVSPASDIETIQTELILADLQTIENALPRLEKDSKRDKDLLPQVAAAKEAQSMLEMGKGVFQAGLDPEPLHDLHLMTVKRQLYVFNCDADELNDEALKSSMRAIVEPAEAIFLDAKFEAELVELDDDDEAREMLADIGVEEPGLDVLARVGFETLGRQSYLTAGPKETRAWTIDKGATVAETSGVLDTDFKRRGTLTDIVSFE